MVWSEPETDRRRLEVFEMWIWRRMEKGLDKVTNEEGFRRVNEDRQILNSIWQTKHRWVGHALKHNGFLHELFEGRMRSRRILMLHDLSNDDSCVALKRATEDGKT